MFKQKYYFAVGAVTLVTVLVFSLPSGAVSRLKLAIGGLSLPLLGTVNTVRQLPGRAADTLLPRSELLRQIDSLQRTNQLLTVQNLQDAAIAQENDRLRALIGWQRQQPWKLKLARVVLYDPANWWRTVQIDLGKRDGLAENLPVLTADGLVGRVSAVGYTRSQVVLVGDPACRVSARVLNPARDMGILNPGRPMDGSLADLVYLSNNANLKPGQPVVTSGEGGIFPAGIPIGQVVDSWQVEGGLYTKARVKLSANLGALEEVWVLFNPQPD
jgi:rod shape-determining protein MreC